MVPDRDGRPAPIAFYRYEDLPELVRFLGDHFEPRVELPSLKVSPPRNDLELPPALKARLEAERAEAFALYASLGRGTEGPGCPEGPGSAVSARGSRRGGAMRKPRAGVVSSGSSG